MASPQTVATARTGSLAQSIARSATPTTLLIDITENWGITSGVVRIGVGDSREWFAFTGLTVVTANSRIQLTGVTRALKKNATSLTDNDTATFAKSHAIGSKVILTHHSAQINKLVQEDADNTLSGDNTLTGTNSFVSTSKATLITQNVTEAQRDALTGAANGAEVYNTDNGTQDAYIGGTWQHLSTGTASNASETTAGVVELGTVAEQGSAAATGGTGAPTVVQTQYLVGTSAGAGDENKIAILDSAGKFDSTFMPDSATKFGGDGSDGAVSGAETITGSNNTYIVKNYTSFAPGANTVTVTPTGCIVHIKVSGNADLSNTTFSFGGKGATGGAGGSAQTGSARAGNNGSEGSDAISYLGAHKPDAGDGGTSSINVTVTTSVGGAAGTVPYPVTTYAYLMGSRAIMVAPGAGGGGGASGGTDTGGTSGAGGTGGAGGGCLILEVAGNLTFSSTTIDCSGADGAAAAAGSGSNYGGSGGGGGGGGGTCVILYGGTLSGSVTPDVSGGAGGALSSGDQSRGGAGGGGGASIAANGTAAADISSGNDGSAGGAGANGIYVLAENTVFQ